MQKSDILILIVDDDNTFGQSLKEAFVRLGYKAHHCKKPEEALAYSKLNVIQGYFIDCMLPQMNGVDLAVKFRENTSDSDLMILMSGIYRDKNFAKNAQKKTGAQEFLFKPFNIDDAIKIVEQHFQGQSTPELVIDSPLYEMMSLDQLSTRQKIKAINGSENVHGFDLPWIFSLLMDEKISGYLTIVLPGGEVAGVGFHDGAVVNVNLKDTQSYFGSLLIERGFVSAEDFDRVMADKSSTKRIGERLVESHLLSPHAVELVVSEQLGIRLSKLIADHSVTVNFNKSDDIQVEARFDQGALCELIDTWIGSKFNSDWLKTLYIPWAQFQIIKGPNYSLSHRALSLPLLARVSDFIVDATSGTNIETLSTSGKYKDSILYPALHMLMIHRLLLFDTRKKTQDVSARKKRLLQLEQELSKRNYFERLNISQTAKENEIKRAYHDLAKALHPDTLDANTPVEMRELTKKVFDKIQLAYDTLKNKNTREDYIKELEIGKAEFVLKADALAEKGKSHLKIGDFQQALLAFQEATQLCPPTVELRMLHLWSEAKTLENKKFSPSAVADFHRRLREIPPEDRHNALYYVARGVIQKLEGRNEEAAKSFNQALHIDPSFIYARREMSVMKDQIDKTQKVDIFKTDIKDVVGMLFKKKK